MLNKKKLIRTQFGLPKISLMFSLVPNWNKRVFKLDSDSKQQFLALEPSTFPKLKKSKLLLKETINGFLNFRFFEKPLKSSNNLRFYENFIRISNIIRLNKKYKSYFLFPVKGGFFLSAFGFLSFVPRKLLSRSSNSFYKILNIKILKKKSKFYKNQDFHINLVSSSKKIENN